MSGQEEVHLCGDSSSSAMYKFPSGEGKVVKASSLTLASKIGGPSEKGSR